MRKTVCAVSVGISSSDLSVFYGELQKQRKPQAEDESSVASGLVSLVIAPRGFLSVVVATYLVAA